jgi:hypothetical protein
LSVSRFLMPCRCALCAVATGSTKDRTMPLSKKGAKIERAMDKTYGPDKGKNVLYASIASGKIKGAEKKGRKDKDDRR